MYVAPRMQDFDRFSRLESLYQAEVCNKLHVWCDSIQCPLRLSECPLSEVPLISLHVRLSMCTYTVCAGLSATLYCMQMASGVWTYLCQRSLILARGLPELALFW